MSWSVEQFLQLLGLFAVLTPGIIFLTGKNSLRKFSWIAVMPPNGQRWVIGIISILLVAVSIAIVVFNSNDATKTTIINDDHSRYSIITQKSQDNKANVSKGMSLSTKGPSLKILNKDIKIVVMVDNERNDVLSDSLAAFYTERGYNATVGSISGLPAGNSIIGDLSASVVEEGIVGTQHYTNYKVKLALKVYKGDGSSPCTYRHYEQKMTLNANGSKETLLEQGFCELLNKVKSAPTTPVCL